MPKLYFTPNVQRHLACPPGEAAGRTARCSTRTRNADQSFDILRTGLPQEHAYDIVYRHALDIDPTGNVLAFGTTTGSFWVSEDQGDHWQCVSEHLPPVFCVRFG
jgi:hypothetical protein